MRYLLTLYLTASALAQSIPIGSPRILGTINLYDDALAIAGDTNMATAFSATGSFVWVEPDGTTHTLNGNVYTLLNDPSAAGCGANMCLFRVNKIDFQTKSNTLITKVQGFGAMNGGDAPAGWNNRICTGCPDEGAGNSGWHAEGLVAVEDALATNIHRWGSSQVSGDSTIIISYDGGLTWSHPGHVNLATISGSSYAGGTLTLVVDSTASFTNGNSISIHHTTNSACKLNPSSITVVDGTHMSFSASNPGTCSDGKINLTKNDGDPPAYGAANSIMFPYSNYNTSSAQFNPFSRMSFVSTCQANSIGCTALPAHLAPCDQTLGKLCMFGLWGNESRYSMANIDIANFYKLRLSDWSIYQAMGGQANFADLANWVAGATGLLTPGYLANGTGANTPATASCCSTTLQAYPESYIATAGSITYIPGFQSLAITGWSGATVGGPNFSDPRYVFLGLGTSVRGDGPWKQTAYLEIGTNDMGFSSLMPFTYTALSTNPPSGKIIMSGDRKGRVDGTCCGSPKFLFLQIDAAESSPQLKGYSHLRLTPTGNTPGSLTTKNVAWMSDFWDTNGYAPATGTSAVGPVAASSTLTGRSAFYGVNTAWLVPSTPPVDGTINNYLGGSASGASSADCYWKAIGMWFNQSNNCHMVSVGNFPISGNPANGWGVSVVANVVSAGWLWNAGSSTSDSGGWANLALASDGTLTWCADFTHCYSTAAGAAALNVFNHLALVKTLESGAAKAIATMAIYVNGVQKCGPATTLCIATTGVDENTSLVAAPMILGHQANAASGTCGSGANCSVAGGGTAYPQMTLAGVTVYNAAPTGSDLIGACRIWAAEITRRGGTAFTCP